MIGCDVVDVARFERVLARRPAMRDRVFTARELLDARRGGVAVGSPVELARLAARFAAKEAARKATGDLALAYRDTEVRTAPSGRPELIVRGRSRALAVSLSHDGPIALAVVLDRPQEER